MQKKINKMPRYTTEEIDFIKENVPGKTDKEVVKVFNENFDRQISECTLSNIKSKLHLKNGLISTTRFQKGSAPVNKNKKWSEYMSQEGQKNSLKTTYKKGHKSYNCVPIGSERISKDGYVEIKIQDGTLQHNWKAKHRIIWEENFGSIPRGHKIIFIDGNKSNFKLSNLALLTNAEEAVMNKFAVIGTSELFEPGLQLARLKLKASAVTKKYNGGAV
jgi:hypothetical protein